MQTCDNGHDEIVYESTHYSQGCPVCTIIDDKDQTISDKEDQIEELTQEVNQLTNDRNLAEKG
jgi:cell division protein FtsL